MTHLKWLDLMPLLCWKWIEGFPFHRTEMQSQYNQELVSESYLWGRHISFRRDHGAFPPLRVIIRVLEVWLCLLSLTSSSLPSQGHETRDASLLHDRSAINLMPSAKVLLRHMRLSYTAQGWKILSEVYSGIFMRNTWEGHSYNLHSLT